MTFELLELDEKIIKALKEEGIEKPTPIQKLAIPEIKSGKDVIGISSTGSGKTLAFGAPIVEKVDEGAGIQVLIMAPTRELALQIAGELRKFSRHYNLNIAAVHGGVSIYPQIDAIHTSEIVVGTPGRLIDLIQRNELDLSKLKIAVLDEADKMVDMGFIDDVEFIFENIPNEKQVLLFGATISDEIEGLKRKHMKNPVYTRGRARVKREHLKQYYYNVKTQEKFSLLMHLLKKDNNESALVFCSTRAMVERVAFNLKKNGISCDMIHGKLNQPKRMKILEEFNKGRFRVLVASAVAARGLDIKNLPRIYNYDLSDDAEEYIHRIGRTARAGESGEAITLLSERDYHTFDQILNRYRMQVKELEAEDFPSLPFHKAPQGRSRSYGRGGYRGRSNNRRESGRRGYRRKKN
jgi:ATP-dependent RNA helicase DeaD